jgi:PEP-CTERM motif
MIKTIQNQLSAKLACLLAIAMLAPLAHASLLSVGGTAPPTPLTPTGTMLATKSGTITALTFTAMYTTSVFMDPSNTFCSNCLDFVYVFTNNGPAPNQRYSMSSFAGFSIDAGTHPFGTHDPNTVSRSLLLNGDVISFNFDQFGNDITPGESTVQLVIETDARNFTVGVLSAQDGSAGSAFGFQPSAVPEPSSLALVGGGLSVFGLLLRKFRLAK